jgi:hemerythrin-like metal-binding protein
MTKVGWPDLDGHKETHQNFRERMLELQRRYKHEPGSVTAEEVLYLVQDWFSNHILGTDMEFKGFQGH